MSYLTGNFSYLVDQGRVRKTNEDSAKACVNAFGNVLLMVALLKEHGIITIPPDSIIAFAL